MIFRSNLVIGIDPAQSGACVILSSSDDGISLIMAVSWRKVTRQKIKVYKVELYDHPLGLKSEIIADHPAMISKYICSLCDQIAHRQSRKIEDLDIVINIEDAYVGRSAKTGIGVAKFAGRVVGVLEAYLNTEAYWVSAGNWRKQVLDLPHFTKREICKKASLDGVPDKIIGMSEALNSLGKLDHLTDAGGIGLWSNSK